MSEHVFNVDDDDVWEWATHEQKQASSRSLQEHMRRKEENHKLNGCVCWCVMLLKKREKGS